MGCDRGIGMFELPVISYYSSDLLHACPDEVTMKPEKSLLSPSANELPDLYIGMEYHNCLPFVDM